MNLTQVAQDGPRVAGGRRCAFRGLFWLDSGTSPTSEHCPRQRFVARPSSGYVTTTLTRSVHAHALPLAKVNAATSYVGRRALPRAELNPRRHAPGAPAPTSRARRPAPTSRARRLPPTADGGGDRPPLRRRPRYRPPTARPRTSVRASRSRVAAVAVSIADRPTTPRDATPAADSGSGHARRRRGFRRRPPPPPA